MTKRLVCNPGNVSPVHSDAHPSDASHRAPERASRFSAFSLLAVSGLAGMGLAGCSSDVSNPRPPELQCNASETSRNLVRGSSVVFSNIEVDLLGADSASVGGGTAPSVRFRITAGSFEDVIRVHEGPGGGVSHLPNGDDVAVEVRGVDTESNSAALVKVTRLCVQSTMADAGTDAVVVDVNRPVEMDAGVLDVSVVDSSGSDMGPLDSGSSDSSIMPPVRSFCNSTTGPSLSCTYAPLRAVLEMSTADNPGGSLPFTLRGNDGIDHYYTLVLRDLSIGTLNPLMDIYEQTPDGSCRRIAIFGDVPSHERVPVHNEYFYGNTLLLTIGATRAGFRYGVGDAEVTLENACARCIPSTAVFRDLSCTASGSGFGLSLDTIVDFGSFGLVARDVQPHGSSDYAIMDQVSPGGCNQFAVLVRRFRASEMPYDLAPPASTIPEYSITAGVSIGSTRVRSTVTLGVRLVCAPDAGVSEDASDVVTTPPLLLDSGSDVIRIPPTPVDASSD
ncbi:hypothetical protein HY990_06655 [Candidatus Micrarchaeota archaeon]|nr:hypothetical protein [Candidatus Micrarchaeota archaeon]